MSEPVEASELQFDRADFAGQAANPTCAACQQPVVKRYFDVNGQMTCATCREAIANTFEKDPGWSAPLLALGAGLAGGVAGSILYYAVVKLTGYEIGLIAIVVGLMVGRAVRWGSGGRGGRGYQVMAVAITYLAIVSTYVPFIVEGIRNSQTAEQQATSVEGAASPGAQTGSAANAANDASSTPAAPANSLQSADSQSAEMSGGEAAIAVGLLFLLLLATPFLAGFQNVIGWLIIGIALWEAWKSNRRVPLAISGPFALAAAPPLPSVPPPLPPPKLPTAPVES